jgi:hypothetical protein
MAVGQVIRLPRVFTAWIGSAGSELARIAASSPQPSLVSFCTVAYLKYVGGQVIPFPRGLQLRAGSRDYKYCWATAPYYSFYFLFFLSAGGLLACLLGWVRVFVFFVRLCLGWCGLVINSYFCASKFFCNE